MKTRILTAVTAVLLLALLGGCSSSSTDAGNAKSGDSKQAANSDGDKKPSSGESKECSALFELNVGLDMLEGDSPTSSAARTALPASYVDDLFVPVKKVLDNLPADFQQAYPVLEKTAHAAADPDLDDDAVIALWAEPDASEALVTLTDSARSVCGLPDTWMKDKDTAGSN